MSPDDEQEIPRDPKHRRPQEYRMDEVNPTRFLDSEDHKRLIRKHQKRVSRHGE